MSYTTQPSLFMPSSDWTPYTGPLPDLRGSAPVAIDLETRDEGIAQERGAGWATGLGHIAGVSVARHDFCTYIPLRHPDTENRDIGQVYSWLEDLLRSPTPTVAHNLAYELGWLGCEGVTAVPEHRHDTQVQAVMLDENAMSYGLGNLAKSRGMQGKDESLLEEAAAAHGCKRKFETKNWIWRLPARFVGPYAEEDARLSLRLHELQMPEIEAAGLRDAYQLEMDILPIFVDMRRRGIRISIDGAEQAQAALRQQLQDGLAELGRRTGRRLVSSSLVDVTALEGMFDQESVPYPRTPKTQRGSFSKDWMKTASHWLPSEIQRLRNLDQMAEKFIGTYILEHVDRGRIHAEIHQLRDEEAQRGTRSYRLSYSNPPLQQMPARSAEGKLVRHAFLPEPDQKWASADYSQQEPRLAVHFAGLLGLPGSADALAYYRDQADADFHTMVATMANIARGDAKIINLGLMYGMGIGKLAVSLGLSREAAEGILDQYNSRLPWVSGLSDTCKRRAEQVGKIKLLDGALCRFDLWEPTWRGDEPEYVPPKTVAEARAFWPRARLKRAFTHKAMNRLIQGSAARQTKMAIRECAREGLCILVQMHDELGFSVDSEAEGLRAAEIMRDVVQLQVPMKVDLAMGGNWGEAT